jgi:N-acetylneuraminic acid mutarotase
MRRAAVALALVALGCGAAPSTALAPAWHSLARATLSRTEVAAARVGGYAYVAGGFERASGATTAATERYDLRRDRWARVAEMPVALNHAAAVSWRGDGYVIGGYRGDTSLSGAVATLYRYDPERDRWTRLESAPTARGALAAGVIGDRLYAVGGVDAAGATLRTLEIYDLRRRRWTRGPSMRVAREHLAAAVAGRRLYVLAGRVGGRNLAVAEAYDPARRRWLRVPSMRKPRGGIAAAAIGGRIVVLGGEEGAGTIREVELYDPARRRWSALPDLPTPRHGLGAVAFRGRVYAFEGGDQPGFHFTDVLEALSF